MRLQLFNALSLDELSVSVFDVLRFSFVFSLFWFSVSVVVSAEIAVPVVRPRPRLHARSFPVGDAQGGNKFCPSKR